MAKCQEEANFSFEIRVRMNTKCPLKAPAMQAYHLDFVFYLAAMYLA
jgi:hypothetical protein